MEPVFNVRRSPWPCSGPICTHTYLYTPFHTHRYINTQQIMLHLNIVLQICNFYEKTPVMEMALTPLFFNKLAKQIQDSESAGTYLTPAYPKVVPYYCVLLSNLHLESSDFCRNCRRRKLVIYKSKFDP